MAEKDGDKAGGKAGDGASTPSSGLTAAINVEVHAGDRDYSMKLDITSAPSKSEPYKFQVKDVTDPDPDKNFYLLQVAIGGKDAAYIGVEPPKDLLKKAGAGDIIKELDVAFEMGQYDQENGKFT